MWIYLGFLAVLLILHEKNIRHDLDLARDNIFKEQNDRRINILTTKYKDACNNEIKAPEIYCFNRNCVLRCCNDGSDLYRDGTCAEDDDTTEFVFHSIFVYKWSEKPPISEVVIHKEELKNDEQVAEFGILQGGFLKIKLRNNTEQWLTAAPLDFCVNIHVAALIVQHRKNVEFIYKYNNVTDHTFKYVVAGMIVSLLVIGYIVYRIRSVPRRIIRLDRWALIFTLTAAYITTTVQQLTSRAGIVTASECRVISPFIYFFVLSIFFWLVAMSLHSWWTIRNSRKNATIINKEVDGAKFKRFYIFCWLFPFFITVYAIVVDILGLATINRPPFDSCLTEDGGMGVYMYNPIAILTAIRGLLYEMKLYNIWRLQRSYNNINDIAKVMISKHSYVVQIKLLVIIAVSGALQLVPNVPWVIFYTIHAYNVLIGTTMLAMFVYERYTYDVPITWYNFSEVCGKSTGTATGDINNDITVTETTLEERWI